MLPDESDTIVAIATPAGAAARGVLRVSGPDALDVVAKCIDDGAGERLRCVKRAALVDGAEVRVELADRQHTLPADLYVWPNQQSYTRQPSVEIHLPGSTPLLEAAVRSLSSAGARLAEPGEFTLRAVLSGRIDLTQAEAVLGVIDARGDADLQTALKQLSGGLAGPLGEVREDLLSLLADLEAGLDFVEEEDVRFIEPDEVARRLDDARRRVAEAAQQATDRTAGAELPLVVLAGPPNAGKSTLFNALVAVAETDPSHRTPALVSEVAGSTRDWLTATLSHSDHTFTLADTAGEVAEQPSSEIDRAVQQSRASTLEEATIVLLCQPADSNHQEAPRHVAHQIAIQVLTKSDLNAKEMAPAESLAVSAASGDGVSRLLDAIAAALDTLAGPHGGGMVASTAARCRQALADTESSLAVARDLASRHQEELVSLEVRSALDGLGQVLGAVAADDVLDRIFSRFCIGK